MIPRFSLYLDAVRLTAALVVLLSHFAYARFSRGDYLVIREFNLGSDAVVAFFVLSGLVIAYTVDRKCSTSGQYTFDRFTRIYSVVLPAIVLTFLFDWLGRALDPAAYVGFWYNGESPWEQFVRAILLNTEWSTDAIRVGSNGPFWSLSYEAAYYIMFGVAVFTRGWIRVAALSIIFLVVGPAVLLLLPVWLMGVLVYRHMRTKRALQHRTLLAMTVLPPLAYLLCLAVNLPPLLLDITHHMLGSAVVNGLLRFSNEFLWNWMIGVLFAMHLIGLVGLMQRRQRKTSDVATTIHPFGSLIRWGAGASFSIYLVHYPSLQLVDTILPETMPPHLRDVSLLGTVLLICFFFAQLFERPIGRLRTFILGLRRFVAIKRPQQAQD